MKMSFPNVPRISGYTRPVTDQSVFLLSLTVAAIAAIFIKERCMGVLFTVVVFIFIGFFLTWLVMRHRKMKLKINAVDRRAKKETPVVYQKKPGDGIEKKPLGGNKHD